MLARLTETAVSRLGEHVVLRRPEPGDFDALAEIRRDPVIQALLLSVVERSDDAAVTEWISRRANDENGLFFVISEDITRSALGYVQVADIHRRSAYGYAGFVVRSGLQGRGVGKAALRLLHARAREAGLEKLLLHARADNAPAINMYVYAGYRFVGLLENHFRDNDGLRHDVLLLERMLDGS